MVKKVQNYKCIGCGRGELECFDHEKGHPSIWLTTEDTTGTGVCSVCVAHLKRFEEGERDIHTFDDLKAQKFALPELCSWVIYKDFIGYDGQYLAVRYGEGKPEDSTDMATSEKFSSESIVAVRTWIRECTLRFNQGEPVCLGRNTDDNKYIIEAWV